MALGDWQISATNIATSGQPVNLTYSESAAFDVSDLLAYRPNVSGNPVTTIVAADKNCNPRSQIS